MLLLEPGWPASSRGSADSSRRSRRELPHVFRGVSRDVSWKRRPSAERTRRRRGRSQAVAGALVVAIQPERGSCSRWRTTRSDEHRRSAAVVQVLTRLADLADEASTTSHPRRSRKSLSGSSLMPASWNTSSVARQIDGLRRAAWTPAGCEEILGVLA